MEASSTCTGNGWHNADSTRRLTFGMVMMYILYDEHKTKDHSSIADCGAIQSTSAVRNINVTIFRPSRQLFTLVHCGANTTLGANKTTTFDISSSQWDRVDGNSWMAQSDWEWSRE